jgi:hypothetical protein
MEKFSGLSQRLAGIEARLEKLQISTSSGEAERVAAKQLAVLARLQRLEAHDCSTQASEPRATFMKTATQR